MANEALTAASLEPIQPIAEAMRLHRGEWLLIGVTKVNRRDEPTDGYLLLHDRRESQVVGRMKHFKPEPGCGFSSLAVRFAPTLLATTRRVRNP